jgi:hypothetical protein
MSDGTFAAHTTKLPRWLSAQWGDNSLVYPAFRIESSETVRNFHFLPTDKGDNDQQNLAVKIVMEQYKYKIKYSMSRIICEERRHCSTPQVSLSTHDPYSPLLALGF